MAVESGLQDVVEVLLVGNASLSAREKVGDLSVFVVNAVFPARGPICVTIQDDWEVFYATSYRPERMFQLTFCRDIRFCQ